MWTRYWGIFSHISEKMPQYLVHIFIVSWPDRKPWSMATSATSETRVTQSSSLREVNWKEGSGYKQCMRSNEGHSIRQKGQAFITAAYRYLKKKNLNEKIKEKDRKGTNAIKIFPKPNPFPPTPSKVLVENKRKRSAQSIPSGAEPKPSISLQDYRQRHSAHA